MNGLVQMVKVYPCSRGVGRTFQVKGILESYFGRRGMASETRVQARPKKGEVIVYGTPNTTQIPEIVESFVRKYQSRIGEIELQYF